MIIDLRVMSCFASHGAMCPVKVTQELKILCTKMQVVLGEERFHGISGMSFGITLARPALTFNSKAILSLFKGLYSVLVRFSS